MVTEAEVHFSSEAQGRHAQPACTAPDFTRFTAVLHQTLPHQTLPLVPHQALPLERVSSNSQHTPDTLLFCHDYVSSPFMNISLFFALNF